MESSKFFAWLSLSLFNGHINKMVMVAEIEVINRLNSMDVHLPKITWL